MSIKNFALKKRMLYMTLFIAVVPLMLIVMADLFSIHQESINHNKKEISELARFLDKRLDRTFAEILAANDAGGLSKKEQVAILNEELQPIIDDLSDCFPGYGVGYYCRELDCVVAFGPNPGPDKLIPLPEGYPGRQVYETGQPLFYEAASKTFRSQPLLAYNLPIYRDGKIIGHTWGNVLLSDISMSFWKAAKPKAFLMVGFLIFSFLWAKRINNNISQSLNYFTIKVLNPQLGPPLKNNVFTELIPVYAALQRQRAAILDDKKLLETLLNATDAGIICVDEDEDVVLVNRAMSSLVSQDLSPFVGKPFVFLLEAIKMSPEACPMAQTLRSRQDISHALIPRTTEDGLRWLSINAVALKDGNSHYKGVLGTFHDVTKLKELENQMVDIERFRVVGELAAAISHEVRNPLTTVKGFLQLFLKRRSVEESDRGLYNLMIEEIDRANSIIGDFLSISRQQHRKNELFSINSLVRDLLLLFESQAVLSDIKVHTDLNEVPQITGDKNQLKQVFLNLFNNSVDAMPKGGSLFIKSCYEKNGNNIKISIKDTGNGIPPEIMSRLGKPFVTTKEKGTGLGLSVCFRIIKNHFGKVSVTSSPETGTEFEISLPAK